MLELNVVAPVKVAVVSTERPEPFAKSTVPISLITVLDILFPRL
jgi:hypothetical protein